MIEIELRLHSLHDLAFEVAERVRVLDEQWNDLRAMAIHRVTFAHHRSPERKIHDRAENAAQSRPVPVVFVLVLDALEDGAAARRPR